MNLSRGSAPADPLQMFRVWYEPVQALATDQSTAVSLATVSERGPSIRVVLLKSYDERGFVFFTNYASRKGRELSDNPQAALCFFWPEVHRQVRIEGAVAKVSEKESDEYFASRDRGSQLGAWASDQSKPIASRLVLEERVAEVERRFPPATRVPRPPHWGGFRLAAEAIEFWQGQPNRLHDRLLYTRDREDGWKIDRLAP